MQNTLRASRRVSKLLPTVETPLSRPRGLPCTAPRDLHDFQLRHAAGVGKQQGKDVERHDRDEVYPKPRLQIILANLRSRSQDLLPEAFLANPTLNIVILLVREWVAELATQKATRPIVFNYSSSHLRVPSLPFQT